MTIRRFIPPSGLPGFLLAGKWGYIHRAYSIEKAKKDLEYQPAVSLREGMDKTLQNAYEQGLLTESK